LASLYHDDVMDEAPLRRGVPTAQKIFGNTAAIMAGDVLFARASSIVSKLGPEAVLLHAKAFERLCVGELHEIAGVPAGVDPVSHYLQVLSDKTGSLIAASAEHGVMAAGGTPEYARAVAAYGEKIGVAFQLADDVIDLVSDPETTGKRAGTDLLENVDTMPTLLLRQAAKDGTIDDLGAEILAALDSGDLTEGPALDRTVAKLRVHDVVEQTRELAQQWTNDSLLELEILPDGQVRDALATFAYAMVHRMA
ncbi:MAG: polyprenyl synthetase family protein, partial [Arcanobacterium sp.]|nr:polyprenyl synthetase family protein [Arcanobacterium sp.]